MNIKRFFIVNYYVQFRAKNSIHDNFDKFWIWNAPVFNDWIFAKKQERRIELAEDLVVENCYKI